MRVTEDRGPFPYLNMVKHKKKKKNQNTFESSDEGDTVHNGKPCSHIAKSVNMMHIRKALKEPVQLMCSGCSKEEQAVKLVDEPSMWFCLQCGYQGCGRDSKGQHSLMHWREPHSDQHAVVVSMSSCQVWCYACDDELSILTNKRLEEAVTFIHKHLSSGSDRTSHILPQAKAMEMASVVKEAHNSSVSMVNGGAISKVKGLSNLGNTCFFNAIIQSISQVRELQHHLHLTESNDVTRTLPGFKEICADDESENHEIRNLDPIELQLIENGELTQALLKLFKDMTADSKNQTLNPGSLFGQICRKVPRFKGFQQQDSHELLRNLLDGLKSEEIKRVQGGLIKRFQVTKAGVNNLDEQTKAKIKLYGQQAKHTLIDSLFGGYLLSTVLCETCNTPSQMFEPFLDLSLPLYEEKFRRGGRKNSEDTDHPKMMEPAAGPSKHQLKKKNKDAKRAARNPTVGKSKKQASAPSIENICMPSMPPDEESQELPNGHDFAGSGSLACTLVTQPDADNALSNETAIKSGGSESPLSGSRSATPKSELGYNTDSEDSVIGDKPTSDVITQQLGSVSTALASMELSSGGEDTDEEEEAPSNQQMAVRLSMTALAALPSIPTSECSIVSGLCQFTHSELLTGPNKYACSNCTERAAAKLTDNKLTEGKPSGSKPSAGRETKQTVYSNASKQLLIFCPPAVLTLHLKRFQQVGFSLSKVNRHVSFSMVLDITPFCSSLSQGVDGSHAEVKYLLFAVVEHSGRLNAGHYTAYVKQRPASRLSKEFLQTPLPSKKPITILMERLERWQEQQKKDKRRSDIEEADPLAADANGSGRWYHISDTHVKEVTERTVLEAQAYILFYERIR